MKFFQNMVEGVRLNGERELQLRIGRTSSHAVNSVVVAQEDLLST